MNDIIPQLQEHLVWALRQQKKYYDEILSLNNEIANRRDLVMKYQGIIEYLRDTQGIKVPETSKEQPQEEQKDE